MGDGREEVADSSEKREAKGVADVASKELTGTGM